MYRIYGFFICKSFNNIFIRIFYIHGCTIIEHIWFKFNNIFIHGFFIYTAVQIWVDSTCKLFPKLLQKDKKSETKK